MDALIFISGHEGDIRVFFENLVNAISCQIILYEYSDIILGAGCRV
jgi:hypothetical protein